MSMADTEYSRINAAPATRRLRASEVKAAPGGGSQQRFAAAKSTDRSDSPQMELEVSEHECRGLC